MGYRYVIFRWVGQFGWWALLQLSILWGLWAVRHVPLAATWPHRLCLMLFVTSAPDCKFVQICGMYLTSSDTLLDFSLPFPVSQCAQDLFTSDWEGLTERPNQPIWCWIHLRQWWALEVTSTAVFSNMYVTHTPLSRGSSTIQQPSGLPTSVNKDNSVQVYPVIATLLLQLLTLPRLPICHQPTSLNPT